MKSEINKNYLWDKSESDAEIEKLENLLQSYRFEQSEAPILPQNIIKTQPNVRRKSFYAQFAVAACLLLTILLGIWSLFSTKNNISDEIVKQNDALESLQSNKQPLKTTLEPQNNTLEPQNNAPEKIFTTSEQLNYRKKPLSYKEKLLSYKEKLLSYREKPLSYKEKPFSYKEKLLNYREKLIKPSKKVLNNKTEVVLTKEESEAYETLKLALSITSKQLKNVKDKIENTEPNSVEINKKVNSQ